MSLGSGIGQLLIYFGGGIVSWHFLNSCIFAWLLSHLKSLFLFSSDRVRRVAVVSLGIPSLWWIDLLHSSYFLWRRIHNFCFSLILITHQVSEKISFYFFKRWQLKLQFIVSSLPTFFWEHSNYPTCSYCHTEVAHPRVGGNGFDNGGFGHASCGQ